METKSRFSADTVAYDAPLHPATVKHLRQVYLTLTSMLVLAAIGALLDIMYNIGNPIAIFATISSLVWLALIPHKQGDAGRLVKRMVIASTLAFFQGVGIGSLLRIVLSMDGGARIIFTAFSGTAAVFTCFTVAALLSDRRSILFVAGMISSLVMVLICFVALHVFVQSELLFDIRIYLGLAVYLLFIVFDTQIMIYDVQERGQTDVVMHALQFFIDFINIFIRLVIMLAKKEDKNSN